MPSKKNGKKPEEKTPPPQPESNMPKGRYVKGKSCGAGKHDYVKSPDGKYAICSKCFSRRTFTAPKAQ